MPWKTMITIWVIIQAIAKIHNEFYNEKYNDKNKFARILGSISWGALMIGALYMAGFYNLP